MIPTSIKKHKFASISLVTLILIIASIWGYTIYDIHNPRRIALILNIKSAPSSVSVFGCESPFTTDVLITCSIKISPDEFSQLLVGWQFEESAIQGAVHTIIPAKVGPEFAVTTEFKAEPKEFKNGGSVSILTNSTRDMAVIDYYEE